MKFFIEQLALVLNKSRYDEARKLLYALGITEWTIDDVVASGEVYGRMATNRATLQFNYTALQKCRELEVLEYTEGRNWLEERPASCVSHLGMHCSEEELREWRRVLTGLGLFVVQEVRTDSHSNPLIKDSRRYHYVMFGAAHLIGVDLKFIVRRELDA